MKNASIAYISALFLFAIIFAILIIDSSIPSFPAPHETINDDLYYIDLNTATAEQLQQIPGIGPKTADNIIDYRQKHGPFSDYNELLNISGISYTTLNTIMEYVRII